MNRYDDNGIKGVTDVKGNKKLYCISIDENIISSLF